MKLIILGKTSYIGTSVKYYMENNHPDMEIKMISSRAGCWEDESFAGYDAVLNTSGLCHADSKHGTPEMYLEINTLLPVKMAQKAKKEGVNIFVQMSSSIVYGNMSKIGVENYIDERKKPEPVNIYGQSKLRAEEELKKLEDEKFKIAILRSPLVYGEKARDNFPKLVKIACITPFFPSISNKQSMIYVDNLAELIYLIIQYNRPGVYLPQDAQYICTAQLVKDIANEKGRKVRLISIFNPLIRLLSRKIYIFNKVFGNVAYRQNTSNYFNGEYRIVNYGEAIKRIAGSKNT